MSESNNGGQLQRRRTQRLTVPIGFRPAPSDDELETNVLERWQGWGLVLTVFMALFIPMYFVLFEPARADDAALEMRAESITRGAAHYALSTETNTAGFGCAQCHGADAGGGVVPNWKSNPEATPIDYKTPSLNDVFKRYVVDQKLTEKDAYRKVFQTISQGRPGTPMPTWGLGYGGPLNDQQIADIINYLISIQKGLPAGTKLAVGEARGPFSRLIAFGAEHH